MERPEELEFVDIWEGRARRREQVPLGLTVHGRYTVVT